VTLEYNGEKVKLDTFETENGFVGVKVPVLESGKIEVKYTGTWLMNFSNFISIVGVCVFVGILFKNNNFLS
jgi:hypothetical protein